MRDWGLRDVERIATFKSGLIVRSNVLIHIALYIARELDLYSGSVDLGHPQLK